LLFFLLQKEEQDQKAKEESEKRERALREKIEKEEIERQERRKVTASFCAAVVDAAHAQAVQAAGSERLQHELRLHAGTRCLALRFI